MRHPKRPMLSPSVAGCSHMLFLHMFLAVYCLCIHYSFRVFVYAFTPSTLSLSHCHGSASRIRGSSKLFSCYSSTAFQTSLSGQKFLKLHACTVRNFLLYPWSFLSDGSQKQISTSYHGVRFDCVLDCKQVKTQSCLHNGLSFSTRYVLAVMELSRPSHGVRGSIPPLFY